MKWMEAAMKRQAAARAMLVQKEKTVREAAHEIEEAQSKARSIKREKNKLHSQILHTKEKIRSIKMER